MTQTKAELLQTRHQGDIRLGDADSTNYVGFKAPATVGSNLVWTLPATDGSANQFLQTNASGVLSWGTADTSASMPLTGGTFTGDVTFTGAAANVVWDKSDNALEFADNARAKFGSGGDLSVYHDGSNSWVSNGTTGQDLYVQSKRDLYFKVGDGSGGNHTCIYADNNGGVQLKHDNTTRIATNSTGIAVTGAATISTDLTVTGDLTVSGTTTTINTQTLDVEDKNVVIGKVSSPSDTTADGGGWTLKGATDKTFNWVNSTDAWTSSEHIHLLDNKKLIVGTGGSDLTISHDGTNSLIDNNTGNLNIQSGGTIYLTNAAGSEVYAQFSENGAASLRYNNTTRLATTSSGINVTGAIQVNGAALSAAPEITGTASGSITAEKAVIANGSGTLAQVAITAASVGSDIAPSSNNQNYHRLIYWTGDKYIYGRKDASNNNLYLQVITISGNSLSYGSEVNAGAAMNNYMEPWSMILNYAQDKIYLLRQYNTSGYLYAQEHSISGTTISAASNAGIVNNSGAMSNMAHVKLANGEVSYFYKRGQNSTMAFRSQGPSSSGPTTMISSVNASWGNFTSCYIPWIDKNIIFYRNNSKEGFLRILNQNSSGAYSSMGTAYQIASGGWGDNNSNVWSKATPSFAVDETNERVAFFYLKNNDQGDQGIHYRILSNIQAGGSITVGAKQTVTTSTGTAIHAAYDSANGQFIMVWNDTSDSDKGKMFKGDSAYPALTNTSTSTFQSSIDVFDENDRTMAFAMGSNNGAQGLIAYTDNSNSNARRFNIYNGASTNLTSENFIGFAKSGVSNGQTATVKVTGNTSTQSSLTFGQKYYVQKDGSIGLSPVSGTSVEAGVALSSTKLLIKG